MTAPLVEARHLGRQFSAGGWLHRSPPVHAVTDVSLTLARGEVVGLVGESGSGKSTIGRLMLGLMPPSAGEVRFDGAPMQSLSASGMRALRKRMQLIFQDPYSSLDPRRRIGEQIADGLRVHRLMPGSQHAGRVAELLDMVGLDPAFASRFPYQFSGGQLQRIAIARALAVDPDFIVADEAVSALDVSVQAQVIALLARLRRELDLSILFISHDLSVVRHLCDRVVVLYLGRVVEEGAVEDVFSNPRHPYTAALLTAAPTLDGGERDVPVLLQGDPPSPATPPPGCVFHTRCPFALPACAQQAPALSEVGGNSHRKACLRDDLRLA